MLVEIPFGEHTLTFDSDDIESFSTPHDTEDVGTSPGGAIERRFTGHSHLLLHFKQDKHARWENPE